MASLCFVCVERAPGGYVVPEEGRITFTCNHSLSYSRGGVLWEVDLIVPGGRASFRASQGLLVCYPKEPHQMQQH